MASLIVDLDIVGSTRYGRNSKISLENTYNMFITDDALVSYSGYKEVKELPGVESRGLFKSTKSNIMIHVIDDNIYEVDNGLNYNNVGNLSTNSGPVFIAQNGIGQFCISDLSNLYAYKVGGTLALVTTPPTPSGGFLPGNVDEQDGYFITVNRLTNVWNISHLNDVNNWLEIDASNGLTYSTTLGDGSDTCQACIVANRLLFIMGNNTTQIYRDVGNTLFPYQRDNSLSFEYGCISIESISSNFGYVIWLGRNSNGSPTLLMSSGGPAKQVSPDGIELTLEQLKYPEDASGYLFEQGSHIFYQITFEKDNLSLVYDVEYNRFFTLIDEDFNHHIARKLVRYNNIDYFMAYASKEANTVKLYEFSPKYSTFNGIPIPQLRYTKPFRLPDARRFRISKIIITMEQGNTVELQKVAIAISRDGGKSFGHPFPLLCNDQGYGANKMVFRKLGSANDITVKFWFYTGDNSTSSLIDDGNLNHRFSIISAVMEII